MLLALMMVVIRELQIIQGERGVYGIILMLVIIIAICNEVLRGQRSITIINVVLTLNVLGLMYVSNNLIYLLILFEMFNFILFILILGAPEVQPTTLVYIIVGNICSLLYIWGVSVFYITNGNIDQTELTVPIIQIITMFKLGLFPFCWWVAPLYESVSTGVFWVLSTIAKVWYMVFISKFIKFMAAGLLTLIPSILYSSVVSVAGSDIKSLLAFSSIINIAFVFFLNSL